MMAAWDHEAFIMQTAGGISHIFAKIMSHWPGSTNLKLNVFAGFNSNIYLRNIPVSDSVRVTSRYIPKIAGKYRVLHPLNKMLFRAWVSTRNVDLIHYTYLDRSLSRKPRPREVMTIHDMIYELFPHCFPKNTPVPRLKKEMAQSVDGIICVSHSTRTDLLNLHNIPEDRITVVHHGNPLEGVKPEANKLLDGPYFLYVGRRLTYKNASIVYRALALAQDLREFRLVLFGGGPITSQESVEIEKLGLKSRVVSVSGDDTLLAGWYSQACALVYPSEYEGFGLPPVEAMSLGCPVIAGRNPAIKETTGTASLLFDPHNLEELVEQLRTVVFRPDVRMKMVETGINHSRQFNWDTCARKTIQFYEKVMN